MEELSINGNEGERGLWLKLILKCGGNGAEERGRIDFVGNIARTAMRDVKNAIERTYQIPRCFQKLYQEDSLLSDENATLMHHRIREGDTLTVEYNATAAIETMEEAVDLVLRVKKVTEELLSPGNESDDIPTLFSYGITNNIHNTFKEHCTGENQQARANRYVFAERGGYRHLFDLYQLVLGTDYALLPFYIRQLESLLVQVVGIALTSGNPRYPEVQSLVAEHSVLRCSLKSFLRTAISHNRWVVAPPGCRDKMAIHSTMQDQQLASLLQFAQVNLSK